MFSSVFSFKHCDHFSTTQIPQQLPLYLWDSATWENVTPNKRVAALITDNMGGRGLGTESPFATFS